MPVIQAPNAGIQAPLFVIYGSVLQALCTNLDACLSHSTAAQGTTVTTAL